MNFYVLIQMWSRTNVKMRNGFSFDLLWLLFWATPPNSYYCNSCLLINLFKVNILSHLSSPSGVSGTTHNTHLACASAGCHPVWREHFFSAAVFQTVAFLSCSRDMLRNWFGEQGKFWLESYLCTTFSLPLLLREAANSRTTQEGNWGGDTEHLLPSQGKAKPCHCKLVQSMKGMFNVVKAGGEC